MGPRNVARFVSNERKDEEDGEQQKASNIMQRPKTSMNQHSYIDRYSQANNDIDTIEHKD